MSESNFERLARINVNEHVEKKGGLSYLSWVWAIDRLLREDADAEWNYQPIQYLPDRTALIVCTVRAFGKDRTMQLPVMDYRMRAIQEPDAFAINTTMQRALVKAIALHGLGLYIYAGEDLPPGEPVKAANDDTVAPPPPPAADALDPKRPNTGRQVSVDAFNALPASEQRYLQDLAVQLIDMIAHGDDAYGYAKSKQLSTDHELAMWHLMPSETRSAIKRQGAAKRAPTPTELASQP